MAPGSPVGVVATSPLQFTNLDLVLRSNEVLFRVIALLHRKHVTIGALIWLPGDRHRQGGRLRLAIASSHAPVSHVITLMQQVIGVIHLRLNDAATDRPRPLPVRPREIPPTRYVTWSQPIGQPSAELHAQRPTGSQALRAGEES
jgi:hypothetical protein